MTQSLSDLVPRLQAHLPQMAVLISELSSELRMAEKLNVIDTRSALGPDALNLAEQLDALLEMKALGILNDDVIAAEQALKTLALDMRARATSRIKDKTSLLRINAEVSAHRADPDIKPMDITEGYRLMAAVSSFPHDVEDVLVVHDLSLPRTGGPVGKIVGQGIAMPVGSYTGDFFDESAPVETFYLPQGRTVRLNDGDFIRVYHHGYAQDQDIRLNDFRQSLTAIDFEATADDVVLHGPMTFSLPQLPSPRSVKKQISAYRETLGKRPSLASVDETAYGLMMFMGIPLIFAFSLAAWGDQTSSIMTGLGVLGIVGIGCVQFLGMKRFAQKAKSPLRDPVVDARMRTGTIGAYDSYDDSIKLMDDIESKLTETSILRMFPARKVVVSQSRGVQVIEPLKALSAPLQEVNLDFSQTRRKDLA